MQSRVEQHSVFVRLLLSANKDQAIALLKRINRLQIRVIAEIIHNVLASNIKLSKYYKTKLSKKKIFYKTLANSSIAYSRKIQLIRNNPDRIYLLVRAVKQDLQELLNGFQEDDIAD